MIISTTPALKRRSGFTLVEVMIGASLGSMVLAGTLSAFLMLSRNGVVAANYSQMESGARRALEEFSQDVRMASDVTWNSSTSLTLTVPNNYTATGNLATYAYDSGSSGSTARTFYRMPGDASATNAKTVLARDVNSFAFARYNRLDAAATTNPETKRIKVDMQLRISGGAAATTTQTAISASFILRNKPGN